MKNVLIIGAGGHGQVIADLVKCLTDSGIKIDLAGFLDDNPDLWGKQNIFGKIFGSLDNIGEIPHNGIVIAIGDNTVRRNTFNKLQAAGQSFITLIHPQATIAGDVKLGVGTVVFAGAVVNTGSVIGDNTIINTGATVDHHNKIGSHVHIAPGSHLGGGVSVGDGAFLGIGSLVIPGRIVGNQSTIGAGSVVVKDIPSNVTAFGVPAKVKSSKLPAK